MNHRFARLFPNSSTFHNIMAIAFSALTLTLSCSLTAIADPVESTPSEVDTSVTRDYEPAVIYLPDAQTQQLVPQSVLITADAPVAGAVSQIIQSYEGQDVGIMSYEVNIDAASHEAEINFEVNHPRGPKVFQSLSSANQVALFEAIRETLLTQPLYSIDNVIFLANGVSFDL